MAKSNSGKKKFRYQKRSKEDIQAAANQRGGNFDSFLKEGIKQYKVRDGKNMIRILPPTWDDARHYAYTLMINYGIGSDNQSYLSLHHMLRKPDPLEEARREANKESDEKLAKALEAKKRSGMWLIDRFDEAAGPQFWAAPFTVDRDIAQMCFDEDSNEAILIDDPDEGCDVRFYREGQGRNTKYPGTKIKIMKPSPISEDEDQQAEWLEYITENPIPDVLVYHDYDHIEAVFGGKAGYDDDDEDDDDKPRKRRSKRDDDDDDDRPKRGKGRSRDDDDDEDEKPARRRRGARDDDDDDDDEKPTKRTAAKRRSRDDDNDDDEEDEKPAKRGKSSSKAKPWDDDDEDDDADDDEADDDDEDEEADEKPSRSSTKTRAARIKERLSSGRDKRRAA